MASRSLHIGSITPQSTRKLIYQKNREDNKAHIKSIAFNSSTETSLKKYNKLDKQQRNYGCKLGETNFSSLAKMFVKCVRNLKKPSRKEKWGKTFLNIKENELRQDLEVEIWKKNCFTSRRSLKPNNVMLNVSIQGFFPVSFFQLFEKKNNKVISHSQRLLCTLIATSPFPDIASTCWSSFCLSQNNGGRTIALQPGI